MTKQHKNWLGFTIIAFSYLPLLLRFTYHYQPSEKTFVKIAADAAFVSFTWLIISGFRQGYLRLIFTPNALSTFHNHLGLWSIALLIFHPVGNAMLYENWWMFVPFAPDNNVYISLGALAFVLLIIIIITSVTLRRLHYDVWNITHYGTYVFYVLVFIHSLISLDLSSPTGIYYLALFGLAMIATATKLLFDLEILSFRTKLVSIEQVAEQTYNLVFAVPRKLHAAWQPGQYVMIALKRFGDNHPFSISRINSNGTVEVTFKIFGNFTRTLAEQAIGQTIFVAGAYGHMHHDVNNTNKNLVFLAGGIGITPFRAVIHEELKLNRDRPVYLLYCAQSPEYLAFHNEFLQLAKQYPRFTYVQVCERNPRTGMESGYVSVTTIEKVVGDITRAHYFACGPAPMMTAVRSMLRQRGIRSRDITLEEFSY